ncbi:MAG: L-aspartate oxidase [Rhodobacteraceae bacterium]|nr:L-aspartate oxidase [Paracoccaceae bacterium]
MTEPSEVLIIGAGLAGLYAALSFAPRSVTVLSPCPLGGGASSTWAQGGVAAAMDMNDTPAAHAKDTVAAGAGIVLPEIAKLVTEAAEKHIAGLSTIGTPFDRTEDGEYVLSREAAHSWPRIVRVKGDQAGKAIMASLIKAVRQTPSITVREGWSAVELLTDDDGICGVLASGPDGCHEMLKTQAYLLAAGGVGSLYAKTTNPPNVCGLAIGMAARAGAVIADAEFVQFHPTAIDLDCDPVPLATEALRGEGAILVNRKGERFMTSLHHDAELAPRDIVARAIFTEYRDGNRPALDTRKAIGTHILKDFPTVSSVCKSNGIDPVTEVIPVIPAAHYHMGGVACDASGQSSIPGLWVAGEAASTGLHGANRLASNGLLEALVFAAICAESISQQLTSGFSQHTQKTFPQDAGGVSNPEDLQMLRQTMSDNVSVLRDEKGLSEALCVIRRLDRRHKNKSVDFANMLAAATVITAAALLRTESRGGHYRVDFPAPDINQARRSFLTLSEARILRDAQ